MFQIGPPEIGADLAFGVDLALFILQCIYMEDFIRLLAKRQSLSGGTSLISMYIYIWKILSVF